MNVQLTCPKNLDKQRRNKWCEDLNATWKSVFNTFGCLLNFVNIFRCLAKILKLFHILKEIVFIFEEEFLTTKTCWKTRNNLVTHGLLGHLAFLHVCLTQNYFQGTIYYEVRVYFCKSKLDKNVDLSLCGLAPAQSQMDIYLDTFCAWNKGPPILANQKKLWLLDCFCHVFAGTGFLKTISFVAVLGAHLCHNNTVI